MKRRILSLLLVLVLLATLAACGNNAPAPTPDPAPAETPAGTTPAEPPAEETLDFPTRPLEALIAWGPGGAGDMTFRALADIFPEFSGGQQLIVRNVEGAGGAVGTTEFMGLPADGYHMQHWGTPNITAMFMRDVAFDLTTFEPVIQLVESVAYILVQYDAPWETIEEFMEDALARPGEITMGNGGMGGGLHLGILLFSARTGIEFNHIGYGGGGPAVTGLLAGEVDAVVAGAPEGLGNVEAGQLRVLATFGAERSSFLPEVPTVSEFGIDVVYYQFRGVSVPGGTPANVIAALHDILFEAMHDPRYIETMEGLGMQIRHRNTEEFRAFVYEQAEILHTLIRENQLGDIYGTP